MSHPSFSKLRSRLLFLVLLAVLPAGGLILYTGWEERRHTAAEAQVNALRLARLAATEHQYLVEGAHQLLRALAQIPQVRGGEVLACNALFADLLRQYSRYTNLGVSRPNGDIFCSALPLPGPVNIADRDYFRRVLQTRAFAVGEYQIGRITGKAGLNFGYPVLDPTGQIQAVVFIALDLAWLNAFVARAELPPGSTLTVLDRTGVILARHPDSARWIGRAPLESSLPEVIRARREGTAEAPDLDGTPSLIAFAPLGRSTGPGDVVVSLAIPKEAATAEANWLLVRNLTWLGSIAVLALAAAWVGGNLFLLRQVKALIGATKRLAAGDLGARSGLPDGPGELNQLARAFDEMAEAAQRHLAFYRATKLLTSERFLDALLQQAVEVATQVIGARYGAIGLLDEGGALQAFIHTGMTPEEMVRVGKLPEGKGILGALLKEGRLLRLDDLTQDPRAHGFPPPHPPMRRFLGVPIVAKGNVLGRLYLTEKESGSFTAEDEALCSSFADIIAGLIEKAQLYQELRLAAIQLEGKVEDRTRDLQAANLQLQEASRRKSEFLANMSHELRTPLNSIIGFAEILQGEAYGPLTEKQARHLTHIWNSGKHLVQLISDILDLSKVEAGKFALQPETLSIQATLEDILVIARGLAHKKAQEIQTDIDPALPPLRADPVRFKQILFNLLSNAVKFTPEEGRITLVARRASADEHCLELAVRDTGVGINAEDLPRLFEEFVQLETTQQKRQEGTGLGLALTKRLVELHGGRIRADSDGKGKGSTFTILLPFGGPPAAHRSSPGGDL